MINNSEKLKNVSTTCISDALDYFKAGNALLGIKPLTPGMRLIGRAFTVKYTPINELNKPSIPHYMGQICEGDVIIIDNAGIDSCTVWGEMLTLAALNSKAKGVVINGSCRDVDEIIKLKFPTFSCSTHMQTGKGRVKIASIQKSIKIGMTDIFPGDLICADSNGIIVIPFENIEEVTRLALAIDKNDKKIAGAIRSGMGLEEAKERFNYGNFALLYMERQQ
jgi:4-hydroxy-4-methyl-2-oxoglutarate aldolase